MKMTRAPITALGSPDHKALLAPLVLLGLDSKLLQCSDTLNSRTWDHVQWVPAGVPRQGWCTTESLSLACWLTNSSSKGAAVLSAQLTRDSPSPRSVHVCPCCVGVLPGLRSGVSTAFLLSSLHCGAQVSGLPCKTVATRR